MLLLRQEGTFLVSILTASFEVYKINDPVTLFWSLITSVWGLCHKLILGNHVASMYFKEGSILKNWNLNITYQYLVSYFIVHKWKQKWNHRVCMYFIKENFGTFSLLAQGVFFIYSTQICFFFFKGAAFFSNSRCQWDMFG